MAAPKSATRRPSRATDADTAKAIKIAAGSLVVVLLTWVLAIPLGMAYQEPQYEITNAFWLIRRLLIAAVAVVLYYFVYQKNPRDMIEDLGVTVPPMATPVAVVLGVVLGLASDFAPTGNTSLNVLGAFLHSAAYTIFFWGLLNHCFAKALGHGFGGIMVTSLVVGLYHFSFPTIIALEGVWLTLWIGQYMVFMGIVQVLLWDRGGQTIVPPFLYCLAINLVIIFANAI